jgi:Ca-activated chloride channel family protein
VIGPRFGRAPHPDDQVPEAQIDVAHGLHFRMRIRGLLGRGRIASPSHAVEVRRHDDHTEVCLSKGGWLDRDVVLTFDLPGGERLGASADADLEEGATVLASFCPQLPIDAPETARGRAITLLVDCSGSMGGVSIAQAKRALQQILATVRPRDRIALVRFGSSIDDVVGAPVSPDSLKMRELHAAVELLDADLGGTELFPALRHALSLAPDEMPADIILITDGQVWDRNGQIASILALAAERGQRIFAVGVGSAVSERQVRALAEGTGGACTMVSPGEQMAPAIQRQFERLFAPRARQVCIDWPAAPSWAQVPQTLF